MKLSFFLFGFIKIFQPNVGEREDVIGRKLSPDIQKKVKEAI